MNHHATQGRRLLPLSVLLAVLVILILGMTTSANAHAAATATNTPFKAKATRTPIATEATGESINATEVSIDTTGDAEAVIQGLRDQQIIPQRPDGSLLFNFVPNTFTKVSTVGSTSLSIGYGKRATEFVLNTEIGWSKAGKRSGCGVAFWETANTSYSLAMLTEDNYVVTAQFAKGKTVFLYGDTSDAFDPTTNNTLTIVAIQDSVSIFVNGKLITTQTGKGQNGKFSTLVYNAKGNTTVTACTYASGWVWTLDQ